MHTKDAMRVVVLLMADSQHSPRHRVKDVSIDLRLSKLTGKTDRGRMTRHSSVQKTVALTTQAKRMFAGLDGHSWRCGPGLKSSDLRRGRATRQDRGKRHDKQHSDERQILILSCAVTHSRFH
jgi:hypothetical protein